MSTKIENTAIIDPTAKIGKNCYIGHFAIIRPNVIIEDGCEIRAHTFIANYAHIGKNSSVYQLSSVCQYAIIEENVFLGPNLIMANTKKISYKRDYECVVEAPYVEYGVRIGAGVTLCPGVRIGRNSLVGAGSVVTKDTEPEYLYFGNPAKKIRKVLPEEILKKISM